jgi:branched-subunit amino acid transport protein
MDFTPGNLFASIIIGAVGLGLFVYGKRQQRMPQLIAGIVLSVYPYFVASVGWMVGIGVAVVAALALAVRAGL